MAHDDQDAPQRDPLTVTLRALLPMSFDELIGRKADSLDFDPFRLADKHFLLKALASVGLVACRLILLISRRSRQSFHDLTSIHEGAAR